MQILASQIKPADFSRTAHSISPEPGTTLDDLLKPSVWAHVARALRAGDIIEVRPSGGEWFAELLVRATSDKAVTVAVIRNVVFDKPQAPAVAGEPFTVKHRGGAGWSVVRNSDKAVVFEGGKTRPDAEAWLEEQTCLA